jgi:hypothetical protein
MKRQALLFRIMLLTIVLAAIIYDLIPFFYGSPDFRLDNHFSLFTTQSNCSVILVYILILLDKRFTVIRGTSLVYTLMATFGFWLFLGGIQGYASLLGKIVACIRHGGSSALVLADIMLFPSDRKLKFSSVGLWMIYPALFLVYTYIRAPFVHWMPYNFLDPSKVSSPLRLSINIGMLLMVGIVSAIGIIALERARNKIAEH